MAQLASCSPEEGVFIAASFPNLRQTILHNLLGKKRAGNELSSSYDTTFLTVPQFLLLKKIALTNPRRVTRKKLKKNLIMLE